MSSDQREIGLIVIERGRQPCLDVMTLKTIVAELSGDMVRFSDRGKASLMTAITLGRECESCGSMTRLTIRNIVSAFQSEGGGVGETHTLPFAGIHGMTFLAVERKSDICMNWIGGLRIVTKMTGFTLST